MKLSNEVKVGILVTISIAALIFGINYLKGKDFFSSNNKYYAVYEDVDGLVKSNSIILNGFKIGQVSDLRFLPDKTGRMMATLMINADVFIPRNSVAKIISSDLFGSKVVQIVLGETTDAANDGDTLISETELGLGAQIMPVKDKAEQLIVSIDSLSVALREILSPKTRKNLSNAIENLNKTFANLEHASVGIDQLVTAEQSKLNKILGNVESISLNLKNNNDRIANILKNFSQISDTLAKAQLASTINNANKTLAEASAVISKINQGQGSIGLLLKNDSLYRNLNNSAADLDKLLIDLKANPKRYVTISIFGGGKSAKQQSPAKK